MYVCMYLHNAMRYVERATEFPAPLKGRAETMMFLEMGENTC